MIKMALSIWLAGAGGIHSKEAWHALTGDEIRVALTGKKLQYKLAWQDFHDSGRTLYNAGADSWGYWRVQNDRYCSIWSPQELWACYDMARSGDRLRFIGAAGDVPDADYARD